MVYLLMLDSSSAILILEFWTYAQSHRLLSYFVSTRAHCKEILFLPKLFNILNICRRWYAWRKSQKTAAHTKGNSLRQRLGVTLSLAVPLVCTGLKGKLIIPIIVIIVTIVITTVLLYYLTQLGHSIVQSPPWAVDGTLGTQHHAQSVLQNAQSYWLVVKILIAFEFCARNRWIRGVSS